MKELSTKERTITVDMDKKCSSCGKAGAMESGICMDCAAKKIEKLGKPGFTQFNEHNFEIAKLVEEDPELSQITGMLVAPDRTVVTTGRIILEVSTPSSVDHEQLSLFGPNFDPVDKFAPFVMPKKEALEISKSIALRHDKEEVKRARIGLGDDSVAVVNVSDSKCDRTFVVQKLSQEFPNHDGMFAGFSKGLASVTINCDLLAPLLQLIARVTEGPVTMTVRGPDEIVTLDWHNENTGQRVRAAIAPMKF